MLALKSVEIRGKIRNPVEYLVELCEWLVSQRAPARDARAARRGEGAPPPTGEGLPSPEEAG